MLLIYTHRVTNRVKYTFNVIFKSILGIEIEITSDNERFGKYEGAKISYTEKPLGDEVFFQSSGMLFETGITTTPPTPLLQENGMKTPKDFFEFTFYLVSRYEEYLPFTADNYGRFSAKQSYSYKNGILHKPVVNGWAKDIQKKITARYPAFSFPQKQYSYTPTIDIDNAYAYRGKNTLRTLGGYVNALLKGNSADFTKRKNVLAGKEKDPYDTYDFQFEIHKKYGLTPIYFFLLGDWAPNDKNLPHTSPLMQELIKNIAGKARTGIHPSYASNEAPEKVKFEKERLEKIKSPLVPLYSPSHIASAEPSAERGSALAEQGKGGQPRYSSGQATVTKSRQHFLKLRFPNTYRNLIAAGITDDYTMGYADEIGFRAGICTPFKWYDLEKEEETNLTIHPFAVMDGTLNNYLKLSPAQALEKVKEVVKEIKEVNGEFISIWHNETLSDWREWNGWKGFYEEMLRIGKA
jgi:hypothetical protein